MSQNSQSGHQSNQSDLLPEVPNSNTQDETQDTLPTTNRPRANVQDPPSILHTSRVSLEEPPPVSHTRRVSLQEPPPLSHTRRVSLQEPPPLSHTRRVSLQEPPPLSHTRRVSLQEPPPLSHTRRVSLQEPPPLSHTRRVSLQEPLPVSHTRRVSIQEPLPMVHTHRVSIQDPSPITYSRRVSIQDPPSITHTRRVSIQDPPPITHTRRVSIQDPPPITHTRRVSIQDPPPITHTRRVSIQDPPPIIHTRRVSIQETSSLSNSHKASFQDTSSVPYSSNFHTQDAPPGFQTPLFSVQSPASLMTHNLNRESVVLVSNIILQGHLSTTQSLRSSTEGAKLPIRAKVDIPPAITNSPEASINSIESILRTSQETSKNIQFTENTLESGIQDVLPRSFVDPDSSRFQNASKSKRRQSQLPLSRRLLHEARKISRQLSLLLSLAGMAILGLIALGQPWMHFRVPLAPPGDPAGPLTIPINTILFVRCSDISCLQEHDYKAYLLDLAWISLLIASITGSCLCLILINLIFFSSSNFPLLDFSIIVIRTSIILGVLFYLMQAHEFLQEGMTYRLGRSFYLAWIGVFLFLMTGFFSFLNYINFWSILALQAIWT